MGALERLADAARRMPGERTKSRVGRVIASFAARAGAEAVVSVTLRDGTRLILDARGRTEGSAVWTGRYDDATLDVLRLCVPSGGVLLDVGANVGLISLPMARHLAASGGTVIAVEPVAVNAARIRQSAPLNNVDVDVLEMALGDQHGLIEISRDDSLGAESGNAVMGRPGAGYGPTSTVEIRRLDDLGSRVGQVHVIKVDIEGAELLFLRGARQFIGHWRPLIFGEFHSGLMPKFGGTFADVSPLLAEWSYKIIAWEGHRQPVVVEAEAGRGNAMLVPSERLDEVLAALKG